MKTRSGDKTILPLVEGFEYSMSRRKQLLPNFWSMNFNNEFIFRF